MHCTGLGSMLSVYLLSLAREKKGGYSVKILNGLNTNCDEYIYSRVSVLKVIESQISSLT